MRVALKVNARASEVVILRVAGEVAMAVDGKRAVRVLRVDVRRVDSGLSGAARVAVRVNEKVLVTVNGRVAVYGWKKG